MIPLVLSIRGHIPSDSCDGCGMNKSSIEGKGCPSFVPIHPNFNPWGSTPPLQEWTVYPHTLWSMAVGPKSYNLHARHLTRENRIHRINCGEVLWPSTIDETWQTRCFIAHNTSVPTWPTRGAVVSTTHQSSQHRTRYFHFFIIIRRWTMFELNPNSF